MFLVRKAMAWFNFTIEDFLTKEERRVRTITAPTPITRVRALTLPLGQNLVLFAPEQTTKAQADCHIFRLPIELRQQIYEEYFGDGLVVVAISNGQKWPNVKLSYDEKVKDFIALLKTCRQIYSEAISFLYSCRTFTFLNPLSFLIFNGSVNASRSRRIQRVVLNCSQTSVDNIPRDPEQWLDYGEVSSQTLIRKQLPSFRNNEYPKFWDAAFQSLQDFSALRCLEVIVAFEKSSKWPAVQETIKHLEFFRGKNVDIVVRVEGFYESDRFVWRWRSRAREASFETADGVVLSRKQIEDGQEWYFET